MTDRPRLTAALTAFQAWWENYDSWDGTALYTDLETAKRHAAYDYEGDEYGHPDEDDDEGANIRPDFTWVEEHGSWHLLDHGKKTLVQISPTWIWRAATKYEIKQQDALAAAEAAERASRPARPLAEELEAAFPTPTR
ncbi:hypothetical protein [Streptomyces sp. FL07-04A]|uniref:hypothetical protein n=1 Tax=Streptomyces sp. FL07-04A TaxID=3028658 RepID=UPI0029AA03AB|nr:hypothetical protein [Streptomyces sp. FL07-04A]MDX3575940.1 hypothetical protein [Streptomyces sp. FL07-04A]